MKRTRPVFLAIAFASVIATAQAKDAVRAEIRDDRFRAGSWEFESLAGAFFLFDRGGNERPTIDYALESVWLGIMLYEPCGPGILSGNVEVLGKLFGGPIFYGPGDVAAGFTVFLRYNFVQPGARFIPYFQAGAGGFTPTSRKEPRRETPLASR